MPTHLPRLLLRSLLALLATSFLPTRLRAQALPVWTDVTPADLVTQNSYEPESVNSVDFGNSTFVALGSRQSFALGEPSPTFVYTSPDGVAWTRHDLNLNGASAYGRVRFVDGRFYLSTFGELTASQLYSSPDGVNWSAGPSLGTQTGSLTDLVAGNGVYVMARESTLSGLPQPAVSADLSHWTTHALPGAESNTRYDLVAFANGHFILAGSEQLSRPLAYTSDDGANWMPGNPAVAVMKWIAGGNGVAVLPNGYRDLQVSTDGLNWTTASPGVQINSVTGTVQSWKSSFVRFVNGQFVGAFVTNDPFTNVYGSADAQNWARLGSLPKIVAVSDLTFGNGRYVVACGYAIYSVAASAVTPAPGKGTQLHGTVDGVADGLNKKGTRRVISGHFTLTNAGTQAARNVQASVFLSDDNKLDLPGDRYLGSVSLADAGYPKIGKNGKSTGTVPFKCSYQSAVVGPTSGKYVLVLIDPQQFLSETDRTDNVLVFGPLP